MCEAADPTEQSITAKESRAEPPSTHPPLKYSELQPLDDQQVMQHMQARNGDALAVLFDRYSSVVLSVALKILRDRAEAEDVLQIIFLEIYQKAGQFDPARGTFYVWLMQFAYCRSINRKNYLAVRQFYGNIPMDDLTEFEQGMMRLYTNPSQECKQFVRQALAMLTDGQKRTIEMVHFQGLTLKEVATQTDETFSTVRHHYYRGLAKLKLHLRSIRGEVGQKDSQVRELGVSNVEA